ncbi:early boundary activity 2 [Haematobia irritans]|uniref:early boundary activity 2 n=1 Tax=Haematobia irritans TaxID=7368 RepID=UPI003F4F5CCA
MVFEQIFSELHITKPSYCNKYVGTITAEMRLKRIAKRQIDCASMFSRLQVIIDKIEEDFQYPSDIRASPKTCAYTRVSDCAYTNSSSGVSSSSSSPGSLNEDDRLNHTITMGVKRKISDEEYNETKFEISTLDSIQHLTEEQYPKQMGATIILGPNGTTIGVQPYESIIWSSSASATRQLLGFIFSSDVLATHTLTGKPSPAFHGRERPAKMQLDPLKLADIIHCVKSRFHCTEREIRAAITTKCSDTSKKYKRRCLKQNDSVFNM